MRARRPWVPPFCALLLAGALPLACAGRTPPMDPRIVVRIDPNVELFALIYLLSGHDPVHEQEIRRSVGRSDERERARRTFAPWRDHPAVRIARDEILREIAWSQFLTHGARCPPFPMSRWTAADSVEAVRRFSAPYLAHVDDFFRATGFDRYVAGRRRVWDRIAEKIRRSAPDAKIIDALERFFGERRARYDLVPSPLGPELVAFSATAPGGGSPVPVTIFGATLDVLGPIRYEERYHTIPYSPPLNEVRPVWLWTYDYRATRLLCAHEWGHAFVDPAIAALDSLVGQSADLYAPIWSRMAAQGYTDWGTCLTEHLVRLGEVRVIRTIEGDDAARRTMEANVARGFVHLPFLAEQVARNYDPHRDRYPSFARYLPALLAALAEVDRASAGAPPP